MSEFQFTTNRTHCPKCGAHRAFAAIRGEQNAGKCFACGIFLPPALCGSANSPWITDDRSSTTPQPRIRLSAVNPVRRDDMLASLHRAWHSRHPFLEILRTLTSADHLRRSPVGLEPDGSILFWYISQDKTVWNAKRIMYVGFHRDRTHPPHYIYRGNPIPLFGEWQLSPEVACIPVALVESEKTAVVMSHIAPDKLWLATGGASSLTEARAKVLAGFRVQIFPDADEAGIGGAFAMQKLLSPIAKSVSIIEPPHHAAGNDLADVVYGNASGSCGYVLASWGSGM